MKYSQTTQTKILVRERTRRLEELLRAVLPRMVNVHVAARDLGYGVEINGMPIEVKWVGDCGLRQAQDLIAYHFRLVTLAARPLIVIARRISEGACDALSKAGIGWVDETGAAEIALGQLIVSRSGRLKPARVRQARWTPAVLAVAEALLCGTKATVASTAQATGLSPTACTNALKTLTELQLILRSANRGPGSARRVDDSAKLLEAYAFAAAAQSRDTRLTVGVTWQDLVIGVIDLGRRWDQAGIKWAATGAIAAAVMAPYLTSIGSGEVYVDVETLSGLESVAADVGLRPTQTGRITLLPFPTVGSKSLAKIQENLCIAPWPRVYADLRRTGVRGEEAAEHLREVLNGR